MCGRYALALLGEDVARAMGATTISPGLRDWVVRFNIAPTQDVPVVVSAPDGGRELALLRWGLIPFWAKDPSIGNRLANARGETLGEKPAFRDAWKRRRCLVPATAFYEWQVPPEGSAKAAKRPHAIGVREDSDELFAMGGIWDRWRTPEGDELRTFAIITVDANKLMRPIHERMPLIVPRASWQAWLGDSSPPTSLVAPFPERAMRAWPVSTKVNNPRHDAEDCLVAV